MLPFCQLHALCTCGQVSRGHPPTQHLPGSSPLLLRVPGAFLFLMRGQRVEDARCFLSGTLLRPQRLQRGPFYRPFLHSSPLKHSLSHPQQVHQPRPAAVSSLGTLHCHLLHCLHLTGSQSKCHFLHQPSAHPPDRVALNFRHQVWLYSGPRCDQVRGLPFSPALCSTGGAFSRPWVYSLETSEAGRVKLLTRLCVLLETLLSLPKPR